MSGSVALGILAPHTPNLVPEPEHPSVRGTVAALRRLAKEIAALKPDAIVCASPHWLARGTFLVNTQWKPACLKDYSGFPAHYYDFEYRPQNDLELARAIAQKAKEAGLNAIHTTDWGLDHGHWSPLFYLAPRADIPVVPLSISTAGPAEHRAFGAAVAQAAAWRNKRVVFVASGTLTHRLDLQTWGRADEPFPEGQAFDELVLDLLGRRAFERLASIPPDLWQAAAPEGNLGTLFELIGAVGDIERAEVLHYDRAFSSVGMATVKFQPAGAALREARSGSARSSAVNPR